MTDRAGISQLREGPMAVHSDMHQWSIGGANLLQQPIIWVLPKPSAHYTCRGTNDHVRKPQSVDQKIRLEHVASRKSGLTLCCPCPDGELTNTS